MQICLDDFTIMDVDLDHLAQLRKCLVRCREGRVSLNPEKCVFWVTSGRLLGHIVSKEGLLHGPSKSSRHPRHATSQERHRGKTVSWRKRILPTLYQGVFGGERSFVQTNRQSEGVPVDSGVRRSVCDPQTAISGGAHFERARVDQAVPFTHRRFDDRSRSSPHPTGRQRGRPAHLLRK